MTIRAGSLQHQISIERSAVTVDDLGRAVDTWSTISTRRAELVEQTIAETQHESGARTEELITFRLRYVADIGLADRLVYEGRAFDLVEILKPERRVELEIKCRRVGP